MGFGASVGRCLVATFLASSVLSACGGHSERAEGDGAAGETQGGSGGTGSGGAPSGGTIGVGGAAPAGGTSDGGTAFGGAATTGGSGGSIAVGGASGSVVVGGTAPCPECPPWDYGLTIEGDREPYEMTFNGHIASDGNELPPSPPLCPEEPLRGTVTGCGGGNVFYACEDLESGSPCLEVTGRTARYIDRQTGTLWSGTVTSDVPNPTIPGVSSGTLTIELAAEGNAMLVLTVSYTFCSPLVSADIVCR